MKRQTAATYGPCLLAIGNAKVIADLALAEVMNALLSRYGGLGRPFCFGDIIMNKIIPHNSRNNCSHDNNKNQIHDPLTSHPFFLTNVSQASPPSPSTWAACWPCTSRSVC